MYAVINQETKIFMAEFGSYDTGMDRYRKLGDDPEAEALDTGERDQLIEDASAGLEAAAGALSPDLQETFQGILDSTDTYFDLDPALATETLETMVSILEQLADLADEDEVEEKVIELQPEIDQLKKMSGRLASKGAH